MVFVNQGATATSTTTVTVDVVPTGAPTSMCVRSADASSTITAPVSPADPCFVAFVSPSMTTLPTGDGPKKVQVWLVDGSGNIAPPGVDDILLDTVAPSAPTNLVATPSHRKVSLTLTAATDATSGVAGYQVGTSRSPGGPYAFGATVSAANVSAVLENTLTWYLVVRAIDAAGNVGPSSAEVSALPDFPFAFELSTPTTSDLKGLAFLPVASRYVLVGDHGALFLANAPMTATPFVRRDAMTDGRLEAVTTNGSALVVAGAAGHLAISTDTGNFWSVLTNTQPSPRDLHDVAFAGAAAPPFSVSHYVAVGDDGTILHGSVDGTGPSPFAPVASPTTKHLRAVTPCHDGTGVCGASSGIVVAVGDDATIVRSTDFGATWTAASVPAAFATAQLKDVAQVPGGNLLYVTGKMPAGQSSVLLSVDGGANWTDFFVPATTDIQGEALTVMGSDLWILGSAGSTPVLARIANGVRTDMNNFSALNGRLSTILARGTAELLGAGPAGELEFTLNPGAATPLWQRAGTAGTTLAVNDLTMPYASSSSLWAVGGLGSIARSVNGGATWATQGSGLVSSTLLGVSAVDVNGTAAGTFVVAVGAGGTILRTSNGGGTWSVDPQSGALTSNTLTAVSCRTTTSCVAVGAPQTVLTFDGVSWAVAFGATTGGYSDVDAYQSSTGVPRAIAVGSSNAYRRFDGVSWLAGIFPSPGGAQLPYWGVAAKRDLLGSVTGTVLAVGGTLASKGVLMKSVDHGSSWVSRGVPGAPALNDVINLPNTSTWYVAGLGGFAARSDDDGETWKQLTTNSTVDFTRLAVSGIAGAAKSVWIGGQRRTVLGSASGGR